MLQILTFTLGRKPLTLTHSLHLRGDIPFLLWCYLCSSFSLTHKSNYFKPSSTHVRESNVFKTLIYSCQWIQFISDPYILTSGNPINSRPLLYTPGNPMLQTLTLTQGHKPLTLTLYPTLKRRHTLFSLMLLVFFLFFHSQVHFISSPYLLTSGNPIYFRPLFTHIRELLDFPCGCFLFHFFFVQIYSREIRFSGKRTTSSSI